MGDQERKYNLRVSRRKEKVQRLIEEQETRLQALEDVTFLRQEDYLKAKTRVQNKLFRLKKEMQLLDGGKLPGI